MFVALNTQHTELISRSTVHIFEFWFFQHTDISSQEMLETKNRAKKKCMSISGAKWMVMLLHNHCVNKRLWLPALKSPIDNSRWLWRSHQTHTRQTIRWTVLCGNMHSFCFSTFIFPFNLSQVISFIWKSKKTPASPSIATFTIQ